MIYTIFTTLGILVAVAAATYAKRSRPQSIDKLTPKQAFSVRLCAVLGAGVGAYLFEWPADHFHWTYLPASLAEHGQSLSSPLGGRTVVGGILGGYLAVEGAKKYLGVQASTGASFAMPLAVALCFGRLGCTFAGCCVGREVHEGDALALLGLPWPLIPSLSAVQEEQVLRIPVPLLEVLFHAACAVWLYLWLRKGKAMQTQFAWYVAAYALFRFAMEFLRENPKIFLGLTYYQCLCMPLFVLAVFQAFSRREAKSLSQQKSIL